VIRQPFRRDLGFALTLRVGLELGPTMKKLQFVMMVPLLLLIVVPLALWMSGVKPPGWHDLGPPLPPIIRIQAMSDLATTRVLISDFIEGQNEHFEGKWLLYGEATLGVDLSKTSYSAVNDATRTATLTLPAPHLVSWKVDPERSTEIYVRGRGYFQWMVSAGNRQMLRDEVWKQADRKIQRLAQDPGYSEIAKLQAEKVLRGLFGGLQWTIAFQWPSPGGEPISIPGV
jgi:hypothetical protein